MIAYYHTSYLFMNDHQLFCLFLYGISILHTILLLWWYYGVESIALIQKISIVIRVTESPWLEFHALRHAHLFYLLVNYAHGLLLHPLHLITIQAILAVAVHPAFHPRSKAGAISFIAFSLLTSTEYLLRFFYHLIPTMISIILQSHTLLAA